MTAEKLPWDADCNATRAAMERFLRALVCTHSHFTDSFTLYPVDKPTRSVSVFFRVWIPQGQELAFLERAGIDELKPPPRVDLGWCADDVAVEKEPRRVAIKRAPTHTDDEVKS